MFYIIIIGLFIDIVDQWQACLVILRVAFAYEYV